MTQAEALGIGRALLWGEGGAAVVTAWTPKEEHPGAAVTANRGALSKVPQDATQDTMRHERRQALSTLALVRNMAETALTYERVDTLHDTMGRIAEYCREVVGDGR